MLLYSTDGIGDKRSRTPPPVMYGGAGAFCRNYQDKLHTVSQKRREQVIRKQNRLQSNHCNLPLPNEMQYEYGANWNNTFKLGTLALVAEDPGTEQAGIAGSLLIGQVLWSEFLNQFNEPQSGTALPLVKVWRKD